jgi:hypothetical protein
MVGTFQCGDHKGPRAYISCDIGHIPPGATCDGVEVFFSLLLRPGRARSGCSSQMTVLETVCGEPMCPPASFDTLAFRGPEASAPTEKWVAFCPWAVHETKHDRK